MKTILALLALLALASTAWATPASVTGTARMTDRNMVVCNFTVVADSTDGTVTDTKLTDAHCPLVDGALIMAIVSPGTTYDINNGTTVTGLVAPTNGYNAELLVGGADLFGAEMHGLSNSAAAVIRPLDVKANALGATGISTKFTTLHITGNSVNSAVINFQLFMSR
jgi:hypothetical protein